MRLRFSNLSGQNNSSCDTGAFQRRNAPVSCCMPVLGNSPEESPLRAWWQEALAGGRDVHREVESEESRMAGGNNESCRAKFRADEQTSHIRRGRADEAAAEAEVPYCPDAVT